MAMIKRDQCGRNLVIWMFIIWIIMTFNLPQCSATIFSLGDYFNMIALVAKTRHFWRKIFQGNDIGFAVYPHFFKDRHPPPFVPIVQTFPKYPMNLDPEPQIAEYQRLKYLESLKSQNYQKPFLNFHIKENSNEKLSTHFQVMNKKDQKNSVIQNIFSKLDYFWANQEPNKYLINDEGSSFGSMGTFRPFSSSSSSSYLHYPGQKLKHYLFKVQKKRRRRKYGEVLPSQISN